MNPSEDILARLKATTKINGAYPHDIEDAIKEITILRDTLHNIRWHLNRYDDDEDTDYFLTKESYNELFVSDQKTT